MSKIEILYKDDHYMAVHKPSGLFVHRSEMDPKAGFILGFVRDMAGGHVWPVHRLDRPTSGIVVFALSKDAAGKLSREFCENRVEKKYLAVVRGYTSESGDINYPLRKKERDGLQEAFSFYKRLGIAEVDKPVGRYETARFSLVEIYPKTGRYHQIRRHFSHIFHPIIGDTVHGDGRQNRFFRERYQVRRLLLAATGLGFHHPYNNERISLNAPPEESMASVVEQLFV